MNFTSVHRLKNWVSLTWAVQTNNRRWRLFFSTEFFLSILLTRCCLAFFCARAILNKARPVHALQRYFCSLQNDLNFKTRHFFKQFFFLANKNTNYAWLASENAKKICHAIWMRQFKINLKLLFSFEMQRRALNPWKLAPKNSFKWKKKWKQF